MAGRRIVISAFFVVAYAALLTRASDVTRAWQTIESSSIPGQRALGQEDDGPRPTLVKVNHQALVDALAGPMGRQSGSKSRPGARQTVSVQFDLPETGLVDCELAPSNVFHPDLVAKYPALILRQGLCSDSRQVNLNLLAESIDSFHATFTIPGSSDFVHVDSQEASTDTYAVKRSGKSKRANFQCGSEELPTVHRSLRETTLPGSEFERGKSEHRRSLQTCANEVAITMTNLEFEKDFASNNLLTDTAGTSFSCGSVPSSAPVRNFRFIAPRTAWYRFSTCKTSSSMVMRVRSGTCSGAFLVTCNSGPPCATATVQLQENAVVYVTVARTSGAALPSSWTLTAEVVQVVGRQYRMAMGISRPLSVAWGGTTVNVLNRLASIMTRLNGIYIREVGAYFQIIADEDRLLCSDEAEITYGACTLSNVGTTEAHNSISAFIAARGVQLFAFEIGHAIGTYGGGLASVGVLCNSGFKMRGASGTGGGSDEGFVRDILSHEVGHQFGASHTMRDCFTDAQYSPSQAVEPASGSTIMSYAGVCNSGKNIQNDADPCFHPRSLEAMRVEMTENATCGTPIVVAPTQMLPTITTPAVGTTCTIPANQNFILRGSTPCADCLYQWDEVNSVPQQDYTNVTNPRFRSWRPTTTPMRYFRNLMYLTNLATLGTRALHELVPTLNTVMNMRFLVKTEYLTTSTAATADSALVGNFAFRDVAVTFTTSQVPLQFTSATVQAVAAGVMAGTQRTFNWNSAGTSSWSPNVEILIAVNTLISTTLSSFNYENAPVDLNWVSLGVVPNNGAATFTLPSLGSLTTVTAAIMIRSSEISSTCSVFDIMPRVSYTNTVTFSPTRLPTTGGPSKAPTTSKPSRSPSTPRPSKAPSTSRPSKVPSRAPTPPTTFAPSRSPTPPTTLSPTVIETVANTANIEKSPLESMVVPIAAGVGGGVALLFAAGLVAFLRRRRQRAPPPAGPIPTATWAAEPAPPPRPAGREQRLAAFQGANPV